MAKSPVSAVDVTLYIGDQVVGGARGIEFSVTRNKRPVATMGTANMHAVARGERLVSGTLTGVVLYAHNLKDAFVKAAMNPDGSNSTITRLANVVDFEVVDRRYTNVALEPKPIIKVDTLYLDELPPMDITLVGVNELGATYIRHILGAEIVTHGYTIDLNTDVAVFETVEFVAHYLQPGELGSVSG